MKKNAVLGSILCLGFLKYTLNIIHLTNLLRNLNKKNLIINNIQNQENPTQLHEKNVHLSLP